MTKLKSGSTKLELKYTLFGGLNANYSVYAVILHEEEIIVEIMIGKAVLRAKYVSKITVFDLIIFHDE